MRSENGRYFKKGKKIGSGTYGTVFEVTRDDGKVFAFKQYNNKSMDMDVGSLREISLLKMMMGLHYTMSIEDIIVDVKEDTNPIVGIVMKKYTNDLYNIIQENNLSIEQKIDITEKLLESVFFIHENGIMHRDIKPENILIGDDGIPVLADFTLAKVFRGIHSYGSHTGNIATLFYRAPEIFNGEKYSYTSDCWSLGVVLYELFTGYCLPVGLDDPKGYIRENNKKIYRTMHGKLICALLNTDPAKRLTAKDALYNMFAFKGCITKLPIVTKKRIVTEEVKEICKLLHTSKPITFLAAQIYKEEVGCLAEYAVELAFKFYETQPYEIEMEEYYLKELEILKVMNFNLFI